MNKIALTIMGLALGAISLSAQERRLEIVIPSMDDILSNKVEISKTKGQVETSLSVAFPMYFGTTVLTDVNYKGAWALTEIFNDGFLEMRPSKNFVYALDLAAMHIRSGAFDVSMGLRWTFMDFTFADPAYTLRRIGSKTFLPSRIDDENPAYDYTKSKIHASYFGIPLRLSLNYDKATIYAGASIELLTEGYSKYKHPKDRQNIREAFNDVRATVEAGFSWNRIGVFVMYGLTPLFPDSLSDARTLSFGLTLGM